jgi:site-specific recombinase XerD
MNTAPDRGQLRLFTPSGARAETPDRLAALPPLSRSSSLGAAAGAFDAHLARAGKTVHTRRAFASDLRLASRFLGAGRPVAAFTLYDLNRFLSWILEYRARSCGPRTYARRVTTLKVFFAWLKDQGLIDDNPAAPLHHGRAVAALPFVLDDAQVAALLAEVASRRSGSPADPRPELLVRLLLDTGMKKGEVVRLRLADVSADARPPSLLVRYDEQRWHGKERRIAFDGALVPVLAAHMDRYRPTDRLFDCTDRNLEYVLSNAVAGAGLPARTSFETLRWTSAVAAHRSGMDPDGLRRRLGLSPISWVETRRKLALLAAA